MGARFFDRALVSQGSHMAEPENAATGSPARHTGSEESTAGMHTADLRTGETRAADPHTGEIRTARPPRPGERSGIQWWEACGGWSVRYAMGTF